MPRPWPSADSRAHHVALRRASADLQRAVGAVRLVDGPRMTVGARNARPARPAPTQPPPPRFHIPDRRSRVAGRFLRSDHAQDFTDDQKMQRSVEERECGALSCRIERRATRQPATSFHVARREAAQGPCDLGRSEVRKMMLVERREPAVERVVHSSKFYQPMNSIFERASEPRTTDDDRDEVTREAD